MLFFGKKKKKEEEEEVVLPPEKVFKDLNSKVRRKRKEPVKPWGKNERYVVLISLLITSGISLFLAVSSRGWKLPGLPRITLPSVSLSETIVISSEEKDETQNKQNQALQRFKETTRDLSGVYGFYVIDLTNNNSYGQFEKEEFEAASLIKLPVMITFYKQIEEGRLRPESRYTLKDADKIGGAGSLQYKQAGSVVTYKELIRLMGKQSDNTAFGIARKILGDEKINEVIKEIGMTKTSLEDNETSSYDMALLLKKLYNNDLITEENKEELLSFLTDTAFENHLPKGIPENIDVAHKYGREVHVINDAGIVLSNKPYVVVIMSKKIVDKEGDEIFPELSKIIWEEMNR